MQKASRHRVQSVAHKSRLSHQSHRTYERNAIYEPQNGPGSDTLYAVGCRYYFTPLAGVLFTFPSRY